MADRAGVPDLENPKGGIEFRDLTFRYPDGEFDVLKNISFTIQPGESVGIVGKTGAGKTALVDLLLRTYNVPDGTLFVDGKDVNGVSIHSVRQACAYVPQENFLFSDTIAHNIAFGVDDATLRTLNGQPALLTSGITLWTSRMATRLSWASAASPSRAVRSSASPSPAPC